MSYLSIMAAAVKDSDREAYIEHARQMWPVFQKLGAIKQVDTWGVDVPEGQLTSFHMAVKREAGESVAVGWVVWPDRETHDRAWESLHNDPDMAMMTLPFDGKRMIFGGFESILVCD